MKTGFKTKTTVTSVRLLFSDSSRGFMKVNLFSSMNCFRAGTRAKDIELKRRTPSLIGKKKKKKKYQKAFTITKII